MQYSKNLNRVEARQFFVLLQRAWSNQKIIDIVVKIEDEILSKIPPEDPTFIIVTLKKRLDP